jgi:hypothetical protein
MSDHFHPWLDQSDDMPVAGHAGFAWSVLGMIAGRTSHIRLGTGVTCPTVRYHPTIIAQAAATMVQRAGAEAGMDGISFINGSAKMDEFVGFAAEHLISAIHSLTATP